MRTLIFALALMGVFMQAESGLGAAPEAKARKAIAALIRSPRTAAANGAGRVILEFANASKYQVYISLCYLPWADSKDLPAGGQLLMVAFVAGNLQKQMETRVPKPEPYAGVLAAIQVYQRLARDDPGFKVPKMERFIAMEHRGALRGHIESLRPDR